MAWFRCHDNSDVIAFLIMTYFHLLWWQFFLKFVYGDVVYAQIWNWPWKTVSSHLHTPVRPMLLQYGLVSFRLFCKNLGHLREFFGQMVYRPPWQKISGTPMSYGIPSCVWGSGGKGRPTCKAGREALRAIGIKPGMAFSLISPVEDTILVNSKMSAIAMWLPQTMQNY